MKFQNRYIEVELRPCIIIGERPGKQRLKDSNQEVFHGNRTGDFVESLIRGKKNIILTNVQMRFYSGIFRSDFDDLKPLRDLIDFHYPSRVICLGRQAQDAIRKTALPGDCEVINLPHPSWVLRFNKKRLHRKMCDTFAHL